MAYATTDDVKTLFRDFADNLDAAVDDTDLTLFLDNTTEIIDSKLNTIYQLPITESDNPKSFKVLKQIQMYKVAGIVDDILNDYAEADKKPMWDKKAIKMLEALVPQKDPKTCKQCAPTMQLPDATYIGTSAQRNAIKISATTGRIFQKGQNNW